MCARSALALAFTLAACRGPPRISVERVVVAESAARQALQRAGVAVDDFGRRASRLFDGAAGFVPAREARAGARRFLGRVKVEGAEVLAAGPGGGALAHVVISVELSSIDGGPALRETGQAAEAVGTEPAGLRGALGRAAAAALERAVGDFSLQIAAEQKRTRGLVKDLSSPEARVRDHAVRVLADRGDRAAVPALVERLHDPDPEVAERTVGALAQLRDPRAVPALIELAHHRDAAYVANLAHVVGDIGGSDAQAWLLTMASGHPDEAVRGAAREALVEMSVRAPHARVEP
jgi:HEAT repeats